MSTLNTIADEITGALNRPFDWQFQARVKSIFRHEAATLVRQSIDKDGLTDHFKTKFNSDLILVDYSALSCGSNCKVIRTNGKVAPPIRYKTDEPFSWIGTADGKVVYIYTKLTELPYANLTEVYQNKPIRYVYENGYVYLKDDSIKTCGAITDVEYELVGSIHTFKVTSTAHKLIVGDVINVVLNITADTPITYDNVEVIAITSDTFNVEVIVTELPTEASGIGTWSLNSSSRISCLSIEGAYPLGEVFGSTLESQLNNTIFDDDTTLPLPEDLIQVIKLKLLQGELSILDDLDKAPDSHLDN